MSDRSTKPKRLFVVISMLSCSPLMAASMSTPAEVSVDRLGAANISIPIQVPPGTAGIAPSIGLIYNSRAGNGLLGVGGAIGGLSSITRCAKTKAQDGANGSVTLGSGDAFCLDGQRLFAVSGAYGATGTEYRTEISNFSKIVSYGATSSCRVALDGSLGACDASSPGWFKVWTKSGQMIEYGNTADSNVQAQGAGGYLVAHTWAMNRIEDVKSNYLTVSYINDSANGEFYPSHIDYTGNSGTGQAPDNSVRFEYDTRPDPTKVYFGPAPLSTSVRLRDVKTYAGTVMVRDYILTYTQSPATSYSRLATVTECQPDRISCRPTLNMEWAEQAQGFTSQRWFTHTTNTGYIAGDVTGSGRTGFLAIAPDAPANAPAIVRLSSDGTKLVAEVLPIVDEGTFKPPSYVLKYTSLGWFAGNFHGTGASSLVNVMDDGYKLWLVSYVPSNQMDKYYYSFSDLPQSGGTQDRKFLVADFDGDGRDDVVSIFNDGFGNAAIDLLRSGQYTNWSTSSTGAGPIMMHRPFNLKQRWFAADVNGDGRADLVCVRGENSSATVDVYLNDGDTFVYASWEKQAGSFSDGQQWFLADVNGDGRPDLVNVFADGYYASVDVHLNTGAGFSAQRWATQVGSYNDPQKWNTPGAVKWLAGDVNGDGRADLINVYNDGGYASTAVLRSAGSFFQQEVWETRAGAYSDSQIWYPADITGMGATHMVNVFNDGDYLSIDAHVPHGIGDRITALSSDLTGRTQIQYYALSGGPLAQDFVSGENVYESWCCGLHPDSVIGAVYVVRSLSKPDGIGGASTTKYAYSSLLTDVRGRGMLGFQTRSETDVEKNLIRSTGYSLDWPYVGMETNSLVKNGPIVLSSTSSTLECRSMSGQPCDVIPGATYFPYVKQFSFSTRDLNNTPSVSGSVTRTYDDWGNVTTLDVKRSVMGVEHHSVTTNTYTNDTANWHIGQLDRSSTTNSQ